MSEAAAAPEGAAAEYEFELVVIGGGSGGLACSKDAAELLGEGKVALLDYVQPSPQGTTWGLGGTCVNVGCIPKKLYHQAALLGHALQEAKHFGWNVEKPESVDWTALRGGITDHIRSLNWGYRVSLRDKKVTYLNSYGTLIDAHTIKTVNKRGVERVITTRNIVLATGGRPRIPDIPGKEFGITSDDVFWMENAPGRTLVVGASYVALECAGYLTGLGFETTVMVRSILLRGFDRECADKIGLFMEQNRTKFIRGATPSKIEQQEDGSKLVTFVQDGEEKTAVFDTVLFAVGRNACTEGLGLEEAGIKLDERSRKVIAENEQTSVPNIYALGDMLEGKPELTPVAIQAGRLLAKRLYGDSTRQMDYEKVPTTVYTPLEYGCCGLSEEEAIAAKGEDNIEVYHQAFTPLEWTVPHMPENVCFAKLICDKTDNERVLGLHYLGPNAGEVTQGFGMALQLNATKEQFDNLVGIHPTVAETLTTMHITKSSGVSALSTGC